MILDTCFYISAIEDDNSKSSKLDTPTGKKINHMNSLEKRTISELFRNKEIIDKST